MDSIWDEIKGFNFDLKWLFKVRSHLEKLERKLQETKIFQKALKLRS